MRLYLAISEILATLNIKPWFWLSAQGQWNMFVVVLTSDFLFELSIWKINNPTKDGDLSCMVENFGRVSHSVLGWAETFRTISEPAHKLNSLRQFVYAAKTA